MSTEGKEKDKSKSLEASLAFASLSGAWLLKGAPEGWGGAIDPLHGPADLPILSSPLGGTLSAIRETIGDCARCRLHQGRTHIVFGVGSEHAGLMFVGEGPGEEEDRRGEPFVGRAGRLLDRMIAAIGCSRAEVYIANVIKCRPPKNRDPSQDEVATCLPFLKEQIEAVNPRVILALGAHAARALLDSDEPIGKLRGRLREKDGRLIMATYHPAYLLRNPEAKRQAWQDLKLARDAARA